MLEQHQALEEERLIGSSAVATGGPLNPALSLIGGGAMQHHPAMSAPTTPPRNNSVLQSHPGAHSMHDSDIAAALSHGLAPGSRLSNGSLFNSVNLGTPQSTFHSPANTTEKRSRLTARTLQSTLPTPLMRRQLMRTPSQCLVSCSLALIRIPLALRACLGHVVVQEITGICRA